MKSLYTSAVSLLALFFFSNAYAQQFEWVHSTGGIKFDKGFSMASDSEGNVYVTGSFSDTVDFDPSPAIAEMDGGYFENAFLAKYDADGHYLWAHSFGDAFGFEDGVSLVIDGDDNIYFCGHLGEIVFDFDPGAGITELVPNGISDIFFARFDGDGNFVWARNFGCENGEHVKYITADSDGNIYLCGQIQDDTDFDPSSGEYILEVPNTSDSFFAKYTSAGDFVWAGTFVGAAGGGDYANCIQVDEAGNVFVTGFFYNTVDFDPGDGSASLTSVGLQDTYLAKFNSQGEYVWAKNTGGLQHEGGNTIAIAGNGTIVLGGFFSLTADLDPSEEEYNLTTIGGNDAYVAAYGPDGAFLWAHPISGDQYENPNALILDENDNVLVTGFYMNTVDFDPSASDDSFISQGDRDIFLTSYDIDGNYLWTRSMGGAGEDRGQSLLKNSDGDIYVTGFFSGTVDFDPSGNIDARVSLGETDMFIVKLNTVDDGIVETSKSVLSAFPNPVNDILSIDLGTYYHDLTVEIYDAVGHLAVSRQFTGAQMIRVDMPAESGIYNVCVKAGEGNVGSARVARFAR